MVNVELQSLKSSEIIFLNLGFENQPKVENNIVKIKLTDDDLVELQRKLNIVINGFYKK